MLRLVIHCGCEIVRSADAGNFIKRSVVIIFPIDTMFVYLFAALSDAAFSQFSLTHINVRDDIIGDYFRKVSRCVYTRQLIYTGRVSYSRDYKAT